MKIRPRLHIFLSLLIISVMMASSCKTPKKTSKSTPATTKTTEKKEKESSNNKDTGKIIQNKYSEILVVPDKVIKDNLNLYMFVEEWTGVPYKYAGKTKQGVDCSSLATILYKEVYNKSIIGSSADLFLLCKPISKDELKEGDLVFFKIEQSKISHIGVYLQNNKFIHSTTKKGVMINDLDEAYYKKYFYKAGRLK